MRTALLAAGLMLVSTSAFAADAIEGDWMPPDGGSKIRVAPCPSAPAQMCGAISWLTPAHAKDLDTRNPNKALRGRPILGVTTFTGFKQAGPGKWTGGKLYDPGSGKVYDGKLTASGSVLKVEGCVLMVCQAQTWKRS